MNTGLVVLLRHLRPLKADALQGIHQILQDLLRGLARLGMLRLQGEKSPGIGEGGSGVVDGAVRKIYGYNIVFGCLIQRPKQLLARIRRLKAVVEGVVAPNMIRQGVPGVVLIHTVLGVNPIGGPCFAIYKTPTAVLEIRVHSEPDLRNHKFCGSFRHPDGELQNLPLLRFLLPSVGNRIGSSISLLKRTPLVKANTSAHEDHRQRQRHQSRQPPAGYGLLSPLHPHNGYELRVALGDLQLLTGPVLFFVGDDPAPAVLFFCLDVPQFGDGPGVAGGEITVQNIFQLPEDVLPDDRLPRRWQDLQVPHPAELYQVYPPELPSGPDIEELEVVALPGNGQGDPQ